MLHSEGPTNLEFHSRVNTPSNTIAADEHSK
jgi:hypothetical protein